MVSFLAKPGWEMPRKSENKNYHFDHFLPEPQQRIEKKIAKNKKNTMITSFQSKTGWERSRKSDNKNYHSNHFLPDPLQRIPKNNKKLKKNEQKKYHYGFFSRKNRLGKAENE